MRGTKRKHFSGDTCLHTLARDVCSMTMYKPIYGHGGCHGHPELFKPQFSQGASRTRKAMAGPVFITDRGRPAHVLLTFEACPKLSGGRTKIAVYREGCA